MEYMDLCRKVIEKEIKQFNLDMNLHVSSVKSFPLTLDPDFNVGYNRCAFLYCYGPSNLYFVKSCITRFFAEYPSIKELIHTWRSNSNLGFCSLSNGPGLDYLSFILALDCGPYEIDFKSVRIIAKSGAWGNTVNFVSDAISEKVLQINVTPEQLGYKNIKVIQGDVFKISNILLEELSKCNVFLMVKTLNLKDFGKPEEQYTLKALKELVSSLQSSAIIFCVDTKPSVALFEKVLQQFPGQFLYQPKHYSDKIPLSNMCEEFYDILPAHTMRGTFFVWQKFENAPLVQNSVLVSYKVTPLESENCNNESIFASNVNLTEKPDDYISSDERNHNIHIAQSTKSSDVSQQPKFEPQYAIVGIGASQSNNISPDLTTPFNIGSVQFDQYLCKSTLNTLRSYSERKNIDNTEMLKCSHIPQCSNLEPQCVAVSTSSINNILGDVNSPSCNTGAFKLDKCVPKDSLNVFRSYAESFLSSQSNNSDKYESSISQPISVLAKQISMLDKIIDQSKTSNIACADSVCMESCFDCNGSVQAAYSKPVTKTNLGHGINLVNTKNQSIELVNALPSLSKDVKLSGIPLYSEFNKKVQNCPKSANVNEISIPFTAAANVVSQSDKSLSSYASVSMEPLDPNFLTNNSPKLDNKPPTPPCAVGKPVQCESIKKESCKGRNSSIAKTAVTKELQTDAVLVPNSQNSSTAIEALTKRISQLIAVLESKSCNSHKTANSCNRNHCNRQIQYCEGQYHFCDFSGSCYQPRTAEIEASHHCNDTIHCCSHPYFMQSYRTRFVSMCHCSWSQPSCSTHSAVRNVVIPLKNVNPNILAQVIAILKTN